MKLPFIFLIALSLTVLAGCSTMNSDFSCKATAADSCLSIEQVDAMTRFADAPTLNTPLNSKVRKTYRENQSQRTDNQPIWVAPWKDKNGRSHHAMKIYQQQVG